MTRKIIAVLIGLFGLALVGALIYFGWSFIRAGTFFGGGEERPAPPSAAAGPFTVVSLGPVFDYFQTQSGIIVLKENGEVLRAKDGTEEVLSPASSDVPFMASISFDKQYLLVGFGTKDFPQFSIYDISKKTWLPLRIGEGTSPVADAVWAPQGLRVAFLEKSGDQWSLGTISFAAPQTPKGATTTTPSPGALVNPVIRRLATLAILDARLTWVIPEKIYLTSIPSAFSRGFLMEYDLQKNVARLLFSDELGLSLRFRGDGALGVKFSLRGQTPSLVSVDGSAKTLRALPFITLPEKCAISETILYCAVPALPVGAQLPDDYHQKAFAVRDALVMMSLSDGTVVTLADQNVAELDATHLTVTNDDLFFINEHDKKLYSIAR
ncbi:MAG: hypothetical protein Q8Q41_01810 [bacterium]|nr:hypothetical protein [bacterium]